MSYDASVLLCAYNSEATIAIAIESILAQEYTSFELIVINDGSTDKTLSIIESYSTHSPKIKVISQANYGIGISRNKAIAEATGQWIAFIDADDAWHPTKLSAQMDASKNLGDVDAIITDTQEFFNDSELIQFFERAPQESVKYKRYNNLGEQLLKNNFDFHPATVLWRAITLKTIGGYGNDRNGEDFKPFLNLAAMGGHLFRINTALYAGRRTANSLSRMTNNHYLGAIARVHAIDELEIVNKAKFLKNNNVDESLLKKGKQRFLRWALHGIRKGYPKATRMTLARPLLGQLTSNRIRLIEWVKTILSR